MKFDSFGEAWGPGNTGISFVVLSYVSDVQGIFHCEELAAVHGKVLTNTGRVFRRRMALGEKVELYMLELDIHCMYLIFYPWVQAGTGCKTVATGIATGSFQIQYNIRIIL